MDIPYTTLDCFQQNYSDQSHLMREMLKEWLRTAVDPHPTWEAVVKALTSPIVNEMNVAAQLELKYCTSIQNTVKESNSTTKKSEGISTSLFYNRHHGVANHRSTKTHALANSDHIMSHPCSCACQLSAPIILLLVRYQVLKVHKSLKN